MEALKWIGSTVAALVVLSVVVGLVLAAGSIIAIVGALAVFIGMILLIAGFIKNLWEELSLK